MRLRDHYDWVVLGDHPGALLSASLAARLGLSVLMLPLAPGAKSMVSSTGQVLDPESNYLLGLGRLDRANGLLNECLGRLGMLPVEADQIELQDAMPQILTPWTRLGLTQDHDHFNQELQREFGARLMREVGMVEVLKQADLDIVKFWLNLPDRLTLAAGRGKSLNLPSTMKELRGRLIRNQRLTHGIEKAWLLPGQKLSSLAPGPGVVSDGFYETCLGIWRGVHDTAIGDPSLADITHAAAVARTGASFQGGITAYRELLIRLARRLGAHQPPKAECRRIFVGNGKFLGVQITNQGNMISASGGVLGCSLAHARESVSVSGRNWLRRMKQAPRPAGWKFTLALTVHAEAIPPGMANRVIWQEAGAPTLEIQVTHHESYGMKSAGQKILFLRSLLPFRDESLSPSFQKLVSARMLRLASTVIPFLEYHIIRIFPDFRVEDPTHASPGGVQAKSQLEEAYGYATLEEIPENLRLFDRVGLGSRSGIEGLFLASGESFPELGSLGGTVAAMESVAWLAHRSGLAGPFA